jgi:small subunit ribosomal protein S16
MAVKLRLMRMGRRHKPFFRLNAIDSRTPRDGRIIEKLGHYDPLEKDTAKQLVIKKDRVEYWIKTGAIPSETVAELIAKVGIESEHYKDLQARKAKARAIAKKKGKLYDNTQRALAKKLADAEAAKAGEAPAEPQA